MKRLFKRKRKRKAKKRKKKKKGIKRKGIKKNCFYMICKRVFLEMWELYDVTF